MTNCACGQPAHDARICTACTRKLQLALLTASVLGTELDIARSRQARFTRTPSGSGSRTPVLPYDPRASDAAMTLHAVLAVWVAAVHGDEPLPPLLIPAMALWLIRHLHRLRQLDGAADALDQIADAAAAGQRAIDRPPARIYAGPCDECGLDLLAKPGALTVVCRRCDELYDVPARQAWMREQLEDYLGNAAYVAMVVTAMGCRVSSATVRKWAQRDRLTARPGGLYRIGDVLDLALARNIPAA